MEYVVWATYCPDGQTYTWKCASRRGAEVLFALLKEESKKSCSPWVGASLTSLVVALAAAE